MAPIFGDLSLHARITHGALSDFIATHADDLINARASKLTKEPKDTELVFKSKP